MSDNEWAHRGPLERFFTWVKLLGMFIIVALMFAFCQKVMPNYLIVAEEKKTDDYYSYYEKQYSYLESTIADMLSLRNQKLDVTLLPSDVFCDMTYDKSGSMSVILYIDFLQEISVTLDVSKDSIVTHQESHKLSKEEFHEKLKADVNAYMGIMVLIISFCTIMIVAILYEIITFCIYFIGLYKERQYERF